MRIFQAISVTCEYVLHDYLIHLPYFAIRNLLAPLLYLFAFGLGVGALVKSGTIAYFSYVFPGILLLTVMQVCYGHFSAEIWLSRRVDKYLELLMMVAPIRPVEAVLGYLIAGIIITFFAAICFLLVAWAILKTIPFSLGWMAVFATGLAVFFTAMGIIAGVSFNNPHHKGAADTLLLLPLSFTCGVFFPLDVYPEEIRWLFYLVPLSQAVEGLREQSIWQLTYVWSTAIVAALAATYVFRRRLVV